MPSEESTKEQLIRAFQRSILRGVIPFEFYLTNPKLVEDNYETFLSLSKEVFEHRGHGLLRKCGKSIVLDDGIAYDLLNKRIVKLNPDKLIKYLRRLKLQYCVVDLRKLNGSELVKLREEIKEIVRKTFPQVEIK